MRPGRPKAAARALALAAALAATPAADAQEPGFFGRLFRPRGGTPPAPTARPAPLPPAGGLPDLETLPRGDRPGTPPSTPFEPEPGPPGLPAPTLPAPGPAAVPNAPTTPLPPIGAGPRIVPQPRVSRAYTDADPIATRITLGRSDDGRTFGMFLQVFADGTVIDSEGAHPLGRDAVRGVVEAVQSGEPFRARGHCGGPPTDFVEQVYLTVFERSLGRLRANSFSVSGNADGCDPAIRRLQAALDALQARISTPTAAAPTAVPDPAVAEGHPAATVAPAPIPALEAGPIAGAPTPPPLVAPAPPPPILRLNEGP